MAFERFKVACRSRGNCGVRLTAAGVLVLTNAAVSAFGVADYRHVRLYYDAATDRLALELVRDRGEDCLQISIVSRAYLISARGFKSKFGIAPGAFVPKLDTGTGLIVCTRRQEPATC